jgi:hypothetical protein
MQTVKPRGAVAASVDVAAATCRVLQQPVASCSSVLTALAWWAVDTLVYAFYTCGCGSSVCLLRNVVTANTVLGSRSSHWALLYASALPTNTPSLCFCRAVALGIWRAVASGWVRFVCV